MNKDEINMHLAAGRYYGRESTCQPYGPDKKGKIRFTEYEAMKQAERLNARPDRTRLTEAYPCYWCSPDKDDGIYNWHVGRQMDATERAMFSGPEAMKLLEMEVVSLNAAEPVFGIQVGEVSLRVHNRKQCEGEYCCIHNPSQHHMLSFPLNWRGDRQIMERICPHGIGHPDPDDAAFRASKGDTDTVHDCDGCCNEQHYYSLGGKL